MIRESRTPARSRLRRAAVVLAAAACLAPLSGCSWWSVRIGDSCGSRWDGGGHWGGHSGWGGRWDNGWHSGGWRGGGHCRR